MNKESSRSHAVFSIYIDNECKMSNGKTIIKKSRFDLIDLAGIQRQKDTETSGHSLWEAGKINNSLMSVRKVMESLLKKEKFIYRESKLAHLLKDSLGGNSKVLKILI